MCIQFQWPDYRNEITSCSNSWQLIQFNGKADSLVCWLVESSNNAREQKYEKTTATTERKRKWNEEREREQGKEGKKGKNNKNRFSYSFVEMHIEYR